MFAENRVGAAAVPMGSTRALVIARSVAVVGLLVIAVAHASDAGSKWHEARYVFFLYAALIVGALAVAALLLRRESRLAWTAAGVVAITPIIGYALSRTTGLPKASGDIGNWGEPLGVFSLVAEGAVLALCVYRLLGSSTRNA